MPNALGTGLPDPLLPDPSNPMAGNYTLADAADFWKQNAADTWKAVKDPQTWVDAANHYGNALLFGTTAPGEGGFMAYHGSPASFDRFSSKFINTGEGAQAYGHGLYFADAEDLARSYRDELSQPGTGHMYQVNIAASPEHMLDWDKPISEQSPNVQAKIQNLANRGIGARNPDPAMTGGEWYVDATGAGHKSADIAAHLHAPLPGEIDPAIPGIRYLDASSRAGGEGSHNYVVFNDKLISILKKYGIAGLFMGGGAAGAASGGGQSTE